MSLFKEKIKYRENIENINFADAMDYITNAIMGKKLQNALSEEEVAKSAIDEILKYYHCKIIENGASTKFDTVESQIEYIMRPYGIKSRVVILDKGWYKDAVGAMLGTYKKDDSAVALIPGRFFGYKYVDVKTGKKKWISRFNENLIDKEAICFYESLPQKSLTIRDLLLFMLRQLNISDIVFYLLLLFISTSLGLLAPLFTKWLFDDVLQYGNLKVLISLAIFMISFSISKLCFDTFRTLINSRVGIKQSIAVESAVMNRIISLPPTFFKKYSAGELSQRIAYIQSLCSSIFGDISLASFTSLFSLIYIGEVSVFAPSLLVPALCVIFATIVISITATLIRLRTAKIKMENAAKLGGLTYATISGIQKIKLAGAEKRMFTRWAKAYGEVAKREYNPPTFVKLSNTFNIIISALGTIVIYYCAIERKVSVPDYYAFNSAFGMILSAFMSTISIAVSIANIKPQLEMAKPIMEVEPEVHIGRENIEEITGEIELSHVSFRYNDSMPYIIDDLSLKINNGEYLAIVGETGCGKSTLLRLLLGFETPEKGIITYDKKNIAKIDLESLRRKIGVVMQDGKLFLGDIYSNITITAPELSVDDAWEAAEIAAIADDIRKMPMGMHTIISEGQGGISGGQRQRLMIARAVAPKPKIIMLDEATNSLDNISQKKVSDAIDALGCTKIVIAHRLSTIQKADKIIFLKCGKIVEEGTYEELIKKNGLFAELIERQRIDKNIKE